MFEHVLSQLDEADQRMVAASLTTLAHYNFFELVVVANTKQITESLNSEQLPESLVQEIVETRIKNRQLKELHALGVTLKDVR